MGMPSHCSAFYPVINVYSYDLSPTSIIMSMNQQDTLPLDMADDHQSARRQVTVSVRATGETDRDIQQDQRQHIAGGQPLPPDASMSPTASSASGRRPSDLSSYAHAMLLHTKQQMDATSGSPPPAYLHVAGPAGAGHRHELGNSRHSHQSQSPSRSQHHHQNSGVSSRSSSIRHGHRQSVPNGMTSALPNGI
ncbi:hypothetical protein SEUCBS139899_010497 [Sporothrix eucalyptigena]|uniref:Uncharacterized protein n=1 Tax=Sporothrix eucalyptigena TaxID=1812306 RepID=A0ABP0C797_9PEZI